MAHCATTRIAGRILLLVSAIACAVTPAGAQAKKPLQEKEIDLRSAIINDTLPFDVPFIVTSTIDKSVTQVDAWIAQVRPASGPLARLAIRCPPREDPGWRQVQPWRDPVDIPPPAGSTDAARKFQLLFPGLDANRFYCARFELGPPKPMTPDQTRAFRTEIFSAIDGPLRAYSAAAVIPRQATDDLRRTLLDAATNVSGKTPRPRPGSVFDRSVSDAAVHQRFLDFLQPIIAAHASRTSTLRNLEVLRQQIANEANNVMRQAELVMKLRSDRGLPPAPASEDLNAWVTASTAALQLGLARLGDLENAWEPEAVDPVAEQLMLASGQVQRGEMIVAAARQALTNLQPAEATIVNALDTTRLRLLQLVGDADGLLRSDDRERGLKNHLLRRRAAIDGVLTEFENVIRTQVELVTTSVGSFDTRHGWYVSADAGLAYGWDVEQAFSYVGTNIYFRPVNKDAPLQSFGSFGRSFSRRFSAMIGVTITGQAEETGRREPLIGQRILVIGAGIRLTDSIRVAGGALVFKEVDPNPLVSRRSVKTSPFVSLSFDVDVAGQLGDLGRAFGIVSTSNIRNERVP